MIIQRTFDHKRFNRTCRLRNLVIKHKCVNFERNKWQLKARAGIRAVPHVSEFKPFPKTPKALRKELGVHGAHIHSLRHTYAYLLKISGVHVTTAQKLMGHEDPGVTLGIYTRFRDEEIDHAGAAILDSLRGKSDYLMF